MKRLFSLFILGASALSFAPLTFGEIQPEAKSAFEKMIAATGGREKILSLETIKMEVNMSMPAMGMSMNGTFIRKAPNLFYVEQEVPGMGTVKTAYDGETGWSVMPMQGFRKLGEAELAQQIEEQDIHAELKYAERYESAEVAGTEMIDGVEHTVVKAVRKRNSTEDIIYFSSETGLMRRISTIADSGPMGSIPVEMEVMAYSEVDGFHLPAKIEVKNPAMNMNMEFKNFEFNGDIDGAVFSPPSE